MVTAKVLETGSYAAAATALISAGVSYSGGIYSLLTTGPSPITLSFAATSATSLAATGVCTVVGLAAGAVASNAEAAFKNDMNNPCLNKAVAEAIESANALAKQYGGRNIVGTTFNEIKPTQDWINWKEVKNYIDKINAGETIKAIEVVDIPGKGKYIIDGHHRYVAGQITNKPVPMTIKPSGSVGMNDWTEINWVLDGVE